MKHLRITTLILSAGMLLGLAACDKQSTDGQSDSPPDAILGKFQTEYPDAKDTNWQSYEGNYMVEFDMNGMEMDITFGPDANILKTEQQIDPANLPANILAFVAAEHPGKTIEEAEEWHANGEVRYEVELSGGGGELVFNGSGQVIGDDDEYEDEEEEEDDDED